MSFLTRFHSHLQGYRGTHLSPFLLWCGSFQAALPSNAQRLSAGCVLLRSSVVGPVMLPFSCFPCGRSEWKNQRRLPQQPASLGISLKHTGGRCHGWTPRLRPENQQVMPPKPRQMCERQGERFVCLCGGQSPSCRCCGTPTKEAQPAAAWLLQANRLLAVQQRCSDPPRQQRRSSPLLSRPLNANKEESWNPWTRCVGVKLKTGFCTFSIFW